MISKTRENLLRRMAERQGLRLVKSGRRDPRALDYGKFALIDDKKNRAIGGPGYHFDIEAVDELLSTGKWKGVTIR